MFDVIVIGLGAMGAAALAALARRKQRVLGLEQFAVGHDRGSSHGHTRVIRTAYYEHPAYVPLCRQAFVAWRQLERRLGRTLLVDTPCLTIGRPDGELVAGVQQAAGDHRLAVETLSPVELRRRFPLFRFDDSFIGVLEHEAGFLYVDDGVRALIDDAAGATVCDRTPVLDWIARPDGVTVRTAAGDQHASRLVITAGPWAGKMLGEFGGQLTVMRQVVFWLDSPPLFAPPQFPVFMADTPEGCFYGVPATAGRGLKLARHYGAPELSGPDGVKRSVQDADAAPMRAFIRRHLPEADRPVQESSVCLYTLTPDRHFVIDRHPQHANVVVACGFSGHGFKFAPVVGEMLADLVDGKIERGPELFQITRFAQ